MKRKPHKATALRLHLKQGRKPVYCRHCLKRVYQEEIEGKWGLVDEEGREHECERNK